MIRVIYPQIGAGRFNPDDPLIELVVEPDDASHFGSARIDISRASRLQRRKIVDQGPIAG